MTRVPAATLTLQIVKYLAGTSGPVRASTISRDLGIPRSTTYHLIRVLQDEGFLVHFAEDQAFALSGLLTELASSVLGSRNLTRFAQPVLERLIAETGLPIVAHLGLLQHHDVLYASKISAQLAPTVVTSIGVRLPAHLTATGRAMLAAIPLPQLRASYPPDQPLQVRVGLGETTVAELDAILDETRSRGWATENGDVTLGYGSVAAAVNDHNGYPAAAIGLTFRSSTIDERQWNRLGVATRNAADALSQRIRGRA